MAKVETTEHALTGDTKKDIAKALWGKDSHMLTDQTHTPTDTDQTYTPTNQTIIHLEAFFRYYQKILKDNTELSQEHILYSVDLLRRNPTVARSCLKEQVQGLSNLNASNAAAVKLPPDGAGSYGERVKNSLQQYNLNVDSAFTVAVRVLFAINMNPHSEYKEGTVSLGQSQILWEKAETLEQLMTKTYTTFKPLTQDEPRSPIQPSKLRARYLEAHAGITIEWTANLPDHLNLNIGKNKKVLQIFELPSLLEASYEALGKEDINLGMQECLIRGSYPPLFLFETLMTFTLLFPSRDHDWLANKVGKEGRWLPWFPWPGRKKVAAQKRDKRLWSALALDDQRVDWGKRPLTNSHELFKRYSYWALRLQILFEEAEDPTPISWTGRWSERHKAARHSFWVAVLAFALAIAFGIMATVLSVVQLWFAYCTWQGPEAATCWTRASASASASTSSDSATATVAARLERYIT